MRRTLISALEVPPWQPRPPARHAHPWIWFALAGALIGLALLLLACIAPVALGSATRRAQPPLVPAPPDPRSR